MRLPSHAFVIQLVRSRQWLENSITQSRPAGLSYEAEATSQYRPILRSKRPQLPSTQAVMNALSNHTGLGPEHMKSVRFYYPYNNHSGDYILNSIASNEETTVYIITQTIGEQLIRVAISMFNGYDAMTPSDAMPKLGGHRYAQLMDDVITSSDSSVVCKMVDQNWATTLTAKLFERNFEAEVLPFATARLQIPDIERKFAAK
jgi:hypothetical protein